MCLLKSEQKNETTFPGKWQKAKNIYNEIVIDIMWRTNKT